MGTTVCELPDRLVVDLHDPLSVSVYGRLTTRRWWLPFGWCLAFRDSYRTPVSEVSDDGDDRGSPGSDLRASEL